MQVHRQLLHGIKYVKRMKVIYFLDYISIWFYRTREWTTAKEVSITLENTKIGGRRDKAAADVNKKRKYIWHQNRMSKTKCKTETKRETEECLLLQSAFYSFQESKRA